MLWYSNGTDKMNSHKKLINLQGLTVDHVNDDWRAGVQGQTIKSQGHKVRNTLAAKFVITR